MQESASDNHRSHLRIHNHLNAKKQFARNIDVGQCKMPFPKKWIPVLSVLTSLSIFWLFVPKPSPTTIVEQGIPIPQIEPSEDLEASHSRYESLYLAAEKGFYPGTVKPVGEPYTKMMVIPRTKEEDVSWVEESFGGNEYIKASIYVVDDPQAPLHPPKNKGHEVMNYLTYIIDSYDVLADVNIFMHSHRFAWHNNELLDQDAVQAVNRLSAERVQREGYMNLRCHWMPGCPEWMHPDALEEDINKQEQTVVARSWAELFPFDPIPHVLAQPCCAQFAISRDRIRSIPLSRYVFYRDWLLRTQLSDYFSGRVWEYIWQFIFTGQNAVCPKEHVCYCDGFGVCFGGEEQYKEYDKKINEVRNLGDELNAWRKTREERLRLLEEGKIEEVEQLPPAEEGIDVELETRIDELRSWCDARIQEAKEHGDVAMNRATEIGRPWKQGDGF
jgi:hypothetical protein